MYVDDFLGLAQGNQERLRHIRRCLLHAIDEVYRPVDDQDSIYRNEAASTKKLLKGDALWQTRKLLLGWIVDSAAMTLELPAHRAERLKEILASVEPGQRRTTLRKWHRLVGELRSMQPAIPGAQGIFGPIQEAFRHKSEGRVRLGRDVHHALADFSALADSVASRPTRIFELIPPEEAVVSGCVDACGTGVSGVLFPTAAATLQPSSDGATKQQPIAWWLPFPKTSPKT